MPFVIVESIFLCDFKDDVIKEKLTTAYESAIVFGRARILTEEQEIVEAAKRAFLKYNEDEELADRRLKITGTIFAAWRL